MIFCYSYTIDNTNDQNEFRVNLNVTIQLDDNTVLHRSVLLHDTVILRIPCDWNTGFYIPGNNIYVCFLNQRECELLSLICVHCDICFKISKFDIASSETTSQLKLSLILNFDTVRMQISSKWYGLEFRDSFVRVPDFIR